MNNIFMCLLMNLKNHGKITSASMFDAGYSKITLVDGNDEYDISVMKRAKLEEEKDD